MPQQPPSPENSEWLTRKRYIDGKLKAADWAVRSFKPGLLIADFGRAAVAEFETANGPADYALCADGKILGIVEAMKLTLGPRNVLSQAERYSKRIRRPDNGAGEYGVPFLYSTNGEVIWHHDVWHEMNRSRRVGEFRTPDALLRKLGRDFEATLGALPANPNDIARLRPYQREANEAIERAIGDRKRELLVAMATGTGKTFTMVNEVYLLMKAGVGRRILFLVDRRALAAGAVRAFAALEAGPVLKFNNIYEVFGQRFQLEDFGEEECFDSTELPSEYLRAPKPGQTFVYISTIQRTATSLFGREALYGMGDEEIDVDANRGDIPIHAFDVIIADECHRGCTSSETAVWRRALDHFDGRRRACMILDLCGDGHRRHILESRGPVYLAPGEELGDRFRIGSPRVEVPNVRREEFDDAPGGFTPASIDANYVRRSDAEQMWTT